MANTVHTHAVKADTQTEGSHTGQPNKWDSCCVFRSEGVHGVLNSCTHVKRIDICHDDATCVHERGRNQISPFRTQVMFSVFRGPKYDDIRPNHTKKYQKITFKVLFSLPPKIH